MRLWTLHPRLLDRQGLTGGWREALLAQAVLAGRTRGYRNHPQLERFRDHEDPEAAVGAFLSGIAVEARARGYRFDVSRIDRPAPGLDTGLDAGPGEGPGLPAGLTPIPASTGQRDHEWARLRAKLADRSPAWLQRWADVEEPEVHPLFTLHPGPIASWERV